MWSAAVFDPALPGAATRPAPPPGDLGAVQERQQRMEAEGLLPGRGRVLLLRVRDRDRGVEVDPQLCIEIVQIRARPSRPRLLAGLGARHPDRVQVRLVDPVQHPPRRGHRGHRPEQLLAVAQHRDPRHRVRAVGDRHRQIGEHPPRRVDRRPGVGVDQSGRDPGDQAGLLGQLPQQTHPGVRHHPGAVRADLDPSRPPCYSSPTECLPVNGDLGLSQAQVSLTGQALPRSHTRVSPNSRETPGLTAGSSALSRSTSIKC